MSADLVLTGLATKLGNNSEKLSDDQAGKKWLRNQRRNAYINVMEAQLQYDIAIKQFDDHRSAEDADEKRLTVLTQEINSAANQLDSWKRRLAAVVNATLQSYPDRTIERYYEKLSPAEGLESEEKA